VRKGRVMEMDELEAAAREAMDPDAWDYYAGGADDEVTVTDNVAAWRRMRLRPHVLRDVSAVSTVTSVLGTEIAAPVLAAPTAYHRLAHEDGERETARGVAEAGTIYVASTLATVSLEEVAAAAPSAPRWFQVYVRRDRGWSAELIERAVEAGYRALAFTVDLPVLGHRPRDERNDFSLPDGMEMANMGQAVPTGRGSGLAAYAAEELDASLTFEDIGFVKEHAAGLPVLVKGVLRGDDAAQAVAAGADGIVVSNHGGRQLDTAIAGADALPDVVETVGGEVPVLVDGGVRRGTDVVKAVALGARAVLVGRPVLWGLASGGAAGVVQVLDLLRTETERAMALCGAARVDDLTADLVLR
jgi:4-hydroxymandelate oxidase